MLIVGIDPGSRFTGLGAVWMDHKEGRILHTEHQVFVASAHLDFADRLQAMHTQLSAALQRLCPEEVAIERIFLGKNTDSAFKLGHIRGICILAASHTKAKIFEYHARSVKKGITGNGAASKEEVQLILFAALGLRGPASLDSSDALALAYHHARKREVERTMARGFSSQY